MKLSIIVPVYNMEADDKLKFCLDSLINQDIDDYEIIAVDDASTDASFEIMKSYEQKYPSLVRAIHSDVNMHQGGAKNIGIKEAKGEWIGFIDADDWISPDMYKKLLTVAENTGAGVVGCDYVMVNDHTYEIDGTIEANSRDDQVGELDHDRKASLILDGGSLCVKIFKRQTIIDNDLWFPKDIFYEDNAMSDGYLLTAGRFEYVKEPLYYYYQHDTSTVHSISHMDSSASTEPSRTSLYYINPSLAIVTSPTNLPFPTNSTITSPIAPSMAPWPHPTSVRLPNSRCCMARMANPWPTRWRAI